MLPQEVLRVGGAAGDGERPRGAGPVGSALPRPAQRRAADRRRAMVLDSRAHVPVGTHGDARQHRPARGRAPCPGARSPRGIPLAYMTLADAQAALLGGQPVVTAVVTTGVPTRRARLGSPCSRPRRWRQHSLTTLASGVSSINKSRTMMWVVAAIIIAALVYVSALQRVRDFAVLKALGSSSAALFGSLCLQAVLVTLLAAVFGTVLSFFMTGVFNQPVSVPASAYATLPLVALVVGVAASLVALRRATSADPVAAFGG